MNMSVMETGCFGSEIAPALIWLLALDLTARNVSLGRHCPRRLWWSVPYSIGVSAWIVFPYAIDVVFASLNPYRPLDLSDFILDPGLWPGYSVLAGCLIAPLAGLALRATDNRSAIRRERAPARSSRLPPGPSRRHRIRSPSDCGSPGHALFGVWPSQ